MNVGGSRKVALAEAIARYGHTGQYDKNGYDYIDHPKAVFYRVFADDADDFDGQIVAWLHDTLEDTEVSESALREFFPAYIVNAVLAITFRAFNKDETRDEYYARVKANPIALRVKLHDIAHNMSPKRLSKLDEETITRLTKKYTHALEVLGES